MYRRCARSELKRAHDLWDAEMVFEIGCERPRQIVDVVYSREQVVLFRRLILTAKMVTCASKDDDGRGARLCNWQSSAPMIG